MASEPKVGDIKEHEQVYVGEGDWVSCAWPSIARRLSAELSVAREMREVLREIEWQGLKVSEEIFDTCPLCEGRRTIEGHAPDCRLARLIGGGE